MINDFEEGRNSKDLAKDRVHNQILADCDDAEQSLLDVGEHHKVKDLGKYESEGGFYITTPIYYVNDKPHIGHAYTSILADILARFYRDEGVEVVFLTGTDEHGQKIQKSAEKAGIETKKFCDINSQYFRDLVKKFNISNTDFIRTTEPRHKDFVQKFWNRLIENGWIYNDVYEGWYSIRDEAFFNEDEIVDGKAPSGAAVEWHKEESYFFRLSEFQEILLELYQKFDFIKPNEKRNEIVSFVSGGLKDLSISRTSFSWGIPVPGDSLHVIYVWLDALANYISAFENNNEYKKFWIEGKKIHLVGKDILRFHSVYWPAFLLAFEYKRGDSIFAEDCKKYLPTLIFSHGWWTNDGQKISKSLGNVIDPIEEVKWIAESASIESEIAVDYFRYFLTNRMSFGSDGDYSRKMLAEKINSDLANNFGNLIQRCATMIYRNCNGRIEQVFTTRKSFVNREIYQKEMMECKFDSVIKNIIKSSSEVNEFFNSNEPWKLAKEGKQKEMEEVLCITATNIIEIATLLSPFIPVAMDRVLEMFGDKIEEPKVIFKKIL